LTIAQKKMMKRNNHRSSSVAIYIEPRTYQLIESGVLPPDLISLSIDKLIKVSPDSKVYCNQKLSVSQEVHLLDCDTETGFLKQVTALLPQSSWNDPDIDEVFFTYSKNFCPLLSNELSLELLDRHIRYLSQYSYSENLPNGIVPFFLSREFVNALPDQLTEDVHSFLFKNINQFDTEIFYKEPDIRQLRLDFSLTGHRSILLSQKLLEINQNLEYSEMKPALLEHPSFFRSYPSYIEIEIYRGCEYLCIFCPRQYSDNSFDGSFLSVEDINRLFSSDLLLSSHNVTVCLGGMGEPLLHPDFHSVVHRILAYPNLSELIIETALYTGVEQLLSLVRLLDDANKQKLSIIVNCTTIDKQTYKDIYSTSLSLDDVLGSVISLVSLLPANKVHVQMLKIQEVEPEIDSFFAFFEKKKIPIILQKYNRFAGLMPERRVTDLTPIHRDFCWHLTRDVYITATGDMKLCRQMIGDNGTIGNIKVDAIDILWKSGETDFSLSFSGKYMDTKAPCSTCDEWYTFNA
jgi:spiro-SPASM protein